VTPSQSWPRDLDVRYEFLEEAGRGGMGVVYKARDRETGELVAVKVLKPEIAADPQSAERFINEVRLSRRITHKNVCRVYEFTRSGSTAYLSMEYVEGESLRSILSRLGSVNVRKGIQIARQICAALVEAHGQGIVHRDLKPENVMLDRSGNVKVMDFGIARLLDAAATQTVGVMGTPAYMAPEQAEGLGIDARTDIYALGLIMYELFTGQSAFSGDTPVAIALKQIRETPPAPRTIDGSLPPELDAIVMRCLEKTPAARFPSVADLDEALAAVLPLQQPRPAGAAAATPASSAWPTVATPEPAAGRLPRLPTRRTALTAAAAIAIAAIGTAAWLLLWRTSDELPFTAFTLPNGLQVLVSEDHSAPTVSVVVTYRVGSRDERAGRRGFAHLFEHMMFAGSLNVGKGEHLAVVSNYGGLPNGQASYDMTRFWQTLPPNQLELALFLEADRMRSLKLEEARLEAERGTVLGEIGVAKENQPYGRVMEALYARAFDTPAYQRDVVGSSEDIRNATLAEVADFFKIYYAPNNAVLTIVGDVDPDHARALVEKFFQHIPAQPPPPVPDLSEPEPTAERRATLEDPFAPAPRLYVAYKAPQGSSGDWPALDILINAFGDGTSSRLWQKLVRETGAVTLAGAAPDRREGHGLATFVLVPVPSRDSGAVLAQFDAMIDEVVTGGLSDVEITRAKRRLELARATALQATRDRAMLLGEYQSKYGDASGLNRRSADLEAVTADDVRRVAAAYLQRERRTVLEVVPGPAAKRPPPQPSAAATVGAPSERFNRAPVARDVLRVRLPESREFRLDNGVWVQVLESAHVPLVTVRFDVRGAGPMYEAPDQPGVALMTAVMLRQGTADRSSREISEELDVLGAQMTVGTWGDPGGIVVTATGLPDTFERWFPIVADIVVRPSFPADELTVSKRSFAAEMAARRSTASAAAVDLFVVVAGVTPVPLVPSARMLDAVTVDQIAAWHRARYVPQNTIVSVAGAVDGGDVERLARATLAAWPATGGSETPPPIRIPESRTVHLLDRPGSVLSTLILGAPATDRADADHLPLLAANAVLGGSPAARLYRSLREARGVSVNPQSQLLTYRHGGFWLVYGDAPTGRAGEAVEAFLHEVRRLSDELVPADELDDAKRSLVGRFALTLEAQAQLASYMAMRKMEGLSADYWERYPDMLQAVTADDIRSAASRHMHVDRIQIVAVGDRDHLVAMMRPFGEVVYYNAEGSPLTTAR
jgi:zinc protease